MQVLAERMGGDAQLIGKMGSDREIAEAAWCCTDVCENRPDADVARLIRFLARASPVHWTPFAVGALIKFRLRMPSFVWDQWRRHQIGVQRMEPDEAGKVRVLWQEFEAETTYNSESRRYVDSPPEFFKTNQGFWRKRSKGRKTGSSDEPLDTMQAIAQQSGRESLIQLAERQYSAALAMGISPEQARMDLPRSVVSTHIEVGSLYAYARIVQARDHLDAEGPIREWARAVRDMLNAEFPVAFPALLQSPALKDAEQKP